MNQNQFALEKIIVPEPPPTTGELYGKVKDGITGNILLGVEVKLDSTISDRVPQNEQMYHFYNDTV